MKTANNKTLKQISSLFCITGIDGCGKGTQIQLLFNRLLEEGTKVAISKAYGEAEKESLAHFMRIWEDLTITLVFQGLHRQQYINAVKYVNEGNIVLADRWDESYISYHRSFGKLSGNPILRDILNNLAFEGKIPQITIMLDIPVSVANKRISARGKDYFDSKGYAYHTKMRANFLKIAKERDWIVLDGTASVSQIHEQIYNIVVSKLNKGRLKLIKHLAKSVGTQNLKRK